MGQDLWISRLTGARRKGTRLKEIRSLFEHDITAQAIAEPLESCQLDDAATTIAKKLNDKGFDVFGVNENAEGQIIGFVSRDSLKEGIIQNHYQVLPLDHLITDSTPLASLLSMFKHKDRLFVLENASVTGIITTADLNKPAVRIYLFGLISLLEMHLTYWVRHNSASNDWAMKLKGKRLAKAKGVLADLLFRDQQTDLVDCLQFCDKRDIVLSHPELSRRLGMIEEDKAKKLLRAAEDLRNLLAHSQKDLTKGSSWSERIEVVEWIETVLHRSDELLEPRI